MQDVLTPVLGFLAVVTEGPDHLELKRPFARNDAVAFGSAPRISGGGCVRVVGIALRQPRQGFANSMSFAQRADAGLEEAVLVRPANPRSVDLLERPGEVLDKISDALRGDGPEITAALELYRWISRVSI